MGRKLAAAVVTLAASTLGALANAGPSGHPAPTITANIDSTRLAELSGNTRPEATAENDRGAVADSLDLGHMFLQLKRSPEREAALKQYIDELHDPKSSNFHQWLTAAQFAEHFGVDAHDVAVVTDWLKSEGFKVHGVTPNGLVVDFSGTAGQIKAAFHSEIHNYVVDDVKHIANSKDPKIPAALTPAVAGVISLHDFRPKPMFVPRVTRPDYTINGSSSTYHAVTAGDIATIYNLNPLLQSGITGAGQTILIPEDTYLYSVTDWTIFRKTFGLARAYPKGSLIQEAPTGSMTCTNPGYAANGDDGEAAIDVEWASAAAPNAAIVLAACKDGATVATFGGLVAIINVLNSTSIPNVVSLSYGESEAQSGAAGNLAFNNAYSQAVSEGVSVFVSSGDELASSAAGGSVTKYGVGISGWTSTPYNVSVGGTDFGYTAYSVPATNYWNTTNTNSYASALSYIQEIPWNNSCAGGALSTYIQTNSYFGYIGPIPGSTPATLCNNTLVTTAPSSGYSAYTFLYNDAGGSGGPSGCATGTPSKSGVVGGTCAGYAKPTWQKGIVGNPVDNVRDIPDVSLMASNGFWDAYYTVCWSNPNANYPEYAGFSCQGLPSTWAGFGGTSVSSPIMAGIQALVNQYTNARWGNPNVVYYSLANTEYGASGSTSCNSTTVNKTSNSCVFYDVTQGDIVGACKVNSGTTAYNCYIPTGAKVGIQAIGTNSTTTTSTSPTAYPTSTGWDFSTGIGSVNAYNLAAAFAAYQASSH